MPYLVPNPRFAPLLFLAVVSLAACGDTAGAGLDDPGGTPPDGDGEPQLVIQPSTIAVAELGEFYDQRLDAVGGSGEGYEWTVVAEELPEGLEFQRLSESVMRIVGYPEEDGSFLVRPWVRDSEFSVVSRAYDLEVAGPTVGWTWRSMTQVRAPSARSSTSAVWTGEEMLVWGGYLQPNVLAEGGAYDPVLDRWRPLSNVGEPEARSLHTAVWTGREMIVWGGVGSNGALAGGRAYDPVTDQWRVLSTDTEPSPRSGHTAVWTGTYMVVFGGGITVPADEGGFVRTNYNDGGLYDPELDLWFELEGPLLFQPRSQASAVWTGSEVVVWGGQVVFGDSMNPVRTDTGAAWHEATRTWRSIPRDLVISRRDQHVAVWGSFVEEMILWGGLDSHPVRALQTGARYSPVTNSWSPISLAGAPGPRSMAHQAWTGRELIVWGGLDVNGSPVPQGGGHYDPLLDRWRPTTQEGSPGSGFISSVWTGSQMLFWGGRVAGEIYGSNGARYGP